MGLVASTGRLERPRRWHQAVSYPPQESTLAHAELPDTVEAVANAIKKHRDFATSMELGLHKVQLALQAGESLQRQGNLYSARVAEAMDSLRTK